MQEAGAALRCAGQWEGLFALMSQPRSEAFHSESLLQLENPPEFEGTERQDQGGGEDGSQDPRLLKEGKIGPHGA